MTKFLHQAIRSFPKEHKYTLGKNILDLSWACLDLTFEANVLPNKNKQAKILELSARFDQLKMRLRMAQEMNLLSEGQFAHLHQQHIYEAGKMLGGWAIWAKTR